MAQKKLKEFCMTLFEFKTNYKVQILMRFLGLIEEIEYTHFDEIKYIKALKFLNKSSRGFEVKSDKIVGNHFFAYVKFLEYLTSEWDKVDSELLESMKRALKEVKQSDPTNLNREGVIDFDKGMIKFLGVIRSYYEKQSGKCR